MEYLEDQIDQDMADQDMADQDMVDQDQVDQDQVDRVPQWKNQKILKEPGANSYYIVKNIGQQ